MDARSLSSPGCPISIIFAISSGLGGAPGAGAAELPLVCAIAGDANSASRTIRNRDAFMRPILSKPSATRQVNDCRSEGANPISGPTEKVGHQFAASEDMTSERRFQCRTLRAALQLEYLIECEDTEEITVSSLGRAGSIVTDIAKIIRALRRALRNAPLTNRRHGRIDIPNKPMGEQPAGASGSTTIRRDSWSPRGLRGIEAAGSRWPRHTYIAAGSSRLPGRPG